MQSLKSFASLIIASILSISFLFSQEETATTSTLISGLLSQDKVGKNVVYEGKARITYAYEREIFLSGTKATLFVQDESAAIYLDNISVGGGGGYNFAQQKPVKATTYAEGMCVVKIEGTLKYDNDRYFYSIDAPTITLGNQADAPAIEPIEITLDQIPTALTASDADAANRGKLVVIKNVTIDSAGSFSNNMTETVIKLTDENGISKYALAAGIKGSRIFGQTIPSGKLNITGIAWLATQGYDSYICPRGMEDLAAVNEDGGDPDQPGGGEEGGDGGDEGDPDQPGGGEEGGDTPGGGEEGGDTPGGDGGDEPELDPSYTEIANLEALFNSMGYTGKEKYRIKSEVAVGMVKKDASSTTIYVSDASKTGAKLVYKALDLEVEIGDVFQNLEVEAGFDWTLYVMETEIKTKPSKLESPSYALEKHKLSAYEAWLGNTTSEGMYVEIDSVSFDAITLQEEDYISAYDNHKGVEVEELEDLMYIEFGGDLIGKTLDASKLYRVSGVIVNIDDYNMLAPRFWSDFEEIGDKATEPEQPEEPTVIEVATIAEWLDSENEGKEVLFTGMAHVQYTQRVGDGGFTTFKHFVQDEAGSAIVLYEYGTQTIQENNWIENIKGAWEKDAMTDFRAVVNTFEAETVAFWDAPWETPAALEATLSDLEDDAYYQENQAKLISLKDCFFHEEGKFEGNKLYSISQGTEDNAKTLFYVPAGSALIGLDIPKIGDTVNMTGVLYEQLTDFSYVTPIVVPYYNKLVVRPALSEEAVEVATIEELKDLPNGQNFLYTGTARITMVKGDMLWLQDASGALRFTKEDHGFERNQGITNINGKLLADNAIDNANFDEAELATENVPEVVAVDITSAAGSYDFFSTSAGLQHQLVVLKNVSFSTEGALEASNGIILPGASSAAYTVYAGNYFGVDGYEKVLGQKVDIYGILAEGGTRLSPRDLSDIVKVGETPEEPGDLEEVEVATIKEIKALQNGQAFVYTGVARVTMVKEGLLWLQDASGALRFTKEDHGFERNQGLTNVKGLFLNSDDVKILTEAEVATENVPVIEPVDMSEEAKGPAFLHSAKEWVDQLVVIKNVSFALEGELDANMNGIILEDDNSASYMVFVSNYFGFDYTKAKDQKFDIYGILTSSQYLSPRDAKDIVAAGETPEWKEEQPVSLGSLVSMGKLGVYPVPARDRFVVELPVEQGDLYIYSESGSLVRMIEGASTQYVVEGLRAGVYALVFRNAQGVYSAKAVVL